MTNVTPGEMLYRKLKTAHTKMERVWCVKPTQVSFENHYMNEFWRFSDFTVFHIVKVGKRKTILCASYFPKSKEISVPNKVLATKAEWDAQLEEWEKKKMWITLTERK